MAEWTLVDGQQPRLLQAKKISVLLRNGLELEGPPGHFRWTDEDTPVDVIAWRLLPEDTPTTSSDPVPKTETETHTRLPTDPKARKAVPIFSGVLMYFPDAIAAVAECSQKGNDQHNPGQRLHWNRALSGDELDALTRHLMEAGTIDSDGIRHSAKVAWRALANLQKEIELERRGDAD